MKIKYRGGSALNSMVKEYAQGAKGLFKKKEEEKTSTGEGYERGDVYFDADAGAFFEHRGDKLDPRHLKGEAGDQETIMRSLKEKGGNAAVGLGSHSELLEKYPGLLSSYDIDKPLGQGLTGSGMKSQVKKIMQEALKTGDPLLMSAIMNPYNESTASGGIGGIDAYGLDRINNTGKDKGISFTPASVTGGGKQYTMGPTDLDKDVVISKDSPLSGQQINTPEGTIRVNPDSMQSPGFGEGVPSTNPDVIREGAVPYQMRSGSALRFLARQRSGSRMRLLKRGGRY